MTNANDHADNDQPVAPSPSNGPQDEFFVGYQPMPPAQARFLRRVWPVLLVVPAALAVAVAARQRDPGSGVWETGTVRTIEGIAAVEPYAMIRAPGEGPVDPVRTVLLVSEGKFGAAERMRPYHHQAVRVRGTLLHRDGRWVLELASADDAVAPASLSASAASRLAIPPSVSVGRVHLPGEFIDPKCYVGAMKPGGGKTHKACAQLCVSGGIPPMFVTRAPDGHETFYLVTAADGAAANEFVLPYLGDPVEIDAGLERRGDLLVLRVSPEAIHRL